MRRVTWGDCMLSAVVVTGMVWAAGCGSGGPTRPRFIPPQAFAPLTYRALVWSAAGDSLGFFHVPLDSIWYDRHSGEAGFLLADSLAGWWTISASGGAKVRRLSDLIADADVHHPTGRMACLASRNGLYANLVAPMTGVVPELRAAIDIGPLGYLPQWNAAGDSLLVTMYEDRIIVASDGTGPRIAARGNGWASWDPKAHAIIVPVWRVYSGEGEGSRIIKLDLDTGDTLVLFSSGAHLVNGAQYSPDGSTLAFVVRPMSRGGKPMLWVAGRNGENARALSTFAIYDVFAWAPDSRRIAVVRYDWQGFTRENSQVWIIDAQTGAATQLTTGS